MALYKLSDGTSSVDLSPTRGLNIPETHIRQLIETKAGKPDAYEWGSAEKYEIPLINITKANADQLLDWWENMEVLTFTPDQASPGDTIQMIIDGIERPLNMWHKEFDNKYAGMAVLCEVSSQSFSSSHVSVSKSKSCSSKSDSESCGISATLSCSLVFLGISRSSFVDTVPVLLESCSTHRSCSTFSTSDLFISCSTFSQLIEGDYWTASSCETTSLVGSDSSCDNVSSCSDSLSDSRSSGVGTLTLNSQSCSLDPAAESCPDSVQPESCSVSAGGIS